MNDTVNEVTIKVTKLQMYTGIFVYSTLKLI